MRVHDCNLMRYAKTRITMLITALHSGQLPPSSATRRAQFSQNLVCPQGTKAKPSIGANRHTSQHRLQQLVLLAPTLRTTRWQQSVSTARRRRNCRHLSSKQQARMHTFALVLLRHFPVSHFPVLQISVLQIQLSRLCAGEVNRQHQSRVDFS